MYVRSALPAAADGDQGSRGRPHQALADRTPKQTYLDAENSAANLPILDSRQSRDDGHTPEDRPLWIIRQLWIAPPGRHFIATVTTA
jgi:hypothetical protein